jgi:hypothetical protein
LLRIDAVESFPWINSDVGRIALIYEPIVIAAKNESVTPGIDIAVVQHGFTEVSRLQFERTWVEVQVESMNEEQTEYVLSIVAVGDDKAPTTQGGDLLRLLQLTDLDVRCALVSD